jgi:heme/copper-type cytochrome/quinol oxidase subunit 2
VTGNRLTRRAVLAGAPAAAVGPLLAGCLDGGSESEPDTPAGNDSASSADGDESTVPMVENLGNLEVTFLDGETTPEAVRVNSDVVVTLLVSNDSDERHVLAVPGGEVTIDVEPGEVAKKPWRVPAEPGTYQLRCSRHEAALTRIEVEPGGVSGGCPSG